LPKAAAPSATSRVTTLPAPISASSPDHHARQDDRPGTDPDITSDADRTAKLQAGSPFHRVTWMVGRQDLHSRPDLGTVADRYLDDVEDHAVEVQENARAEADIEAVVADVNGCENPRKDGDEI
jgi:hypothetical protein